MLSRSLGGFFLATSGQIVSSPAVRDYAVAAPEQEHHLGIAVVGGERPTVAEDDRLARAPVLVEDLGAVRGKGSNLAGRVRPQT